MFSCDVPCTCIPSITARYGHYAWFLYPKCSFGCMYEVHTHKRIAPEDLCDLRFFILPVIHSGRRGLELRPWGPWLFVLISCLSGLT